MDVNVDPTVEVDVEENCAIDEVENLLIDGDLPDIDEDEMGMEDDNVVADESMEEEEDDKEDDDSINMEQLSHNDECITGMLWD